MTKWSIRFFHWTETDSRVEQFLRQVFGVDPAVSEHGADLIVGDLKVEVKACSEYVVTNHAKYSKRRRGRFQLVGRPTDDSDYILFVLVKDASDIRMKLLKSTQVAKRFRKTGARSINWARIFTKEEAS